ncbi:MAG: hypothetical protein ACI3XA_04625 [Clostridia bacterium]
MARKVVITRGEKTSLMLYSKYKLSADAVVDCVLRQEGTLICEKRNCDTAEDGSGVIVEFSENETMRLVENRYAELQFRWYSEEDAGVSDVIICEVKGNFVGTAALKVFKFYYGSVCTEPSRESEVEALNMTCKKTFTVSKGKYCIASEGNIKKIRDVNMFDNTNDFNVTKVGKYYVYTYKHSTTIPMEFSVYL